MKTVVISKKRGLEENASLAIFLIKNVLFYIYNPSVQKRKLVSLPWMIISFICVMYYTSVTAEGKMMWLNTWRSSFKALTPE